MKNIVTFENFNYNVDDELNEGLFSKKSFKELFDTKEEEVKKYITQHKGDLKQLMNSDNWDYRVMAAMSFQSPNAQFNSAKNLFTPVPNLKSTGGSEFNSGISKERLLKKYPEYKVKEKTTKVQGQAQKNVQGQAQKNVQGQAQKNVQEKISSFSNFKI